MPEGKTKQFNYLAIATLIIALLAIIATFTLYQKTAELTASINDQNAAISSLTKKLATQQQQFEDHKETITKLHTVTTKLATSNDEAGFAIQMAIYELELLQDYARAIEYLNLAMLHINDADITKQISSAIAALKKIPHYDLMAKLGELDNIKTRLVSLDLTEAKKTYSAPSGNMSFLNNLVTVSYTDHSEVKLLRPNQQHMVEANLLALINQAKSALANKNDALWRSSIAKLNSTLSSHFAQNSHIKTITAELAALDKLELNPKTPDLQAILNAVYNSRAKDNEPTPHIKPSTKLPPTAQNTQPHITAEF